MYIIHMFVVSIICWRLIDCFGLLCIDWLIGRRPWRTCPMCLVVNSLFGRPIDRFFIDWFINLMMIDRSIDWLIDWLIYWSIYWFVGAPRGHITWVWRKQPNWSIDWFIGMRSFWGHVPSICRKQRTLSIDLLNGVGRKQPNLSIDWSIFFY